MGVFLRIETAVELRLFISNLSASRVSSLLLFMGNV